MERNLNRRVESLTKISRDEHKKELVKIFDLYLSSKTAAWHLLPDGKWLRVNQDPNGAPLAELQPVMIDTYRVNS